MASASCFLRTLSLKWSRNDDRVVGKKQQFWCVTNKKCPKLMSEFSEIIFFSSQLFFRCTTSWSLNSFLVAIQDKTSLTWLQNSMGNTKQLTIIIDTKIRFLRVAHDELQNFLAAEEEQSGLYAMLIMQFPRKSHRNNINCSNTVFLDHLKKTVRWRLWKDAPILRQTVIDFSDDKMYHQNSRFLPFSCNLKNATFFSHF